MIKKKIVLLAIIAVIIAGTVYFAYQYVMNKDVDDELKEAYAKYKTIAVELVDVKGRDISAIKEINLLENDYKKIHAETLSRLSAIKPRTDQQRQKFELFFKTIIASDAIISTNEKAKITLSIAMRDILSSYSGEQIQKEGENLGTVLRNFKKQYNELQTAMEK